MSIASNQLEVWLNFSSFDLLMLDAGNGGEARLNFFRTLKEYFQDASTGLLVFGGTPATASSLVAAGVDGFLEKPIQLREIKDCVSTLTAGLTSNAPATETPHNLSELRYVPRLLRPLQRTAPVRPDQPPK